MLTRPGNADDDGSIVLLVIGYTTIAIVLLIVGVDLSSVFLARRALGSTTDSAALAAAQGVDRRAVYAGRGLGCGQSLPLAGGDAQALAVAAVQDARPGLRAAFRSVGTPTVAVTGSRVGVNLTGEVRLPFGRVIGWLDPPSRGTIRVTETSHARSPVVGAGGC